MSLLQSVFLPFALLAALAAGDGFLGVYLEDADGATITQVIPKTAAAKAGLRVGDKFRTVNGKKTADLDSFLAAMGKFDAGDEVTLGIQRGENRLEKVVVLGKRPDEMPGIEAGAVVEVIEEEPASRPAKAKPAEAPARLRPTRRATESAPATGRPFLGVQVEEQDEGGLLITDVVEGGPSAAAGLKVGDRVTALGRADNIRTLSDLTGVLGKMRAGQTVRAKVRRGGESETVSIKLGARPEEGGGEAAEHAGAAAEHVEKEHAEKAHAEKAHAEQAHAEKAHAEQAQERAHAARQQAEKAHAEETARSRRMATRLDRGAEDDELRRLRGELRSLREEIRELKELVRAMNKKK